MRIQLQPLALAILISGVGTDALSQGRSPTSDLTTATLEDLMNIEITSASRKEQRAEEVPSAVYVITHDDIRRSGMTSVPDLLRLVPGVQVAQINSSKFAVSVRGFNGIYSNKLLVLIDGRSLYNPLFAGVLWDTEDVMLEDVDRIEVIRGPGAAVWGANAVNGVINILTRPATETGGLLVRAGTGTSDRGNLAIRYGGAAGKGAYRTFLQLSTHGNSLLAKDVEANDHWRTVTSGFRGDWSMGPEAFMLQGNASVGQQRPLWLSLDPAPSLQPRGSGVSDTQVGSVLGRWAHTRHNGATLQLQSFMDIAHRRETVGDYRRATLDFDADYHTTLRRKHDLVLGGGYRYIREAIDGGVGYSFNPSRSRISLFNAFAQDEISLSRDRVKLTLGAKFEHDTFAGSSLQPTARAMWNITSRRHLWAAVSQAVRTPSLNDYGIHLELPPAIPAATPGTPPSDFPVAISVFGNPAALNERLFSVEGGYRFDIGSKAAVAMSGFIDRYERLQTAEPGAPSLIFVDGRPVISVSTVFQNLLDADTKGVEITGRAMLSGAWQVDGTFSAFHLTPHPDAASHDPVAAAFDGNAPRYQWRGHSAVSLGPRVQADVLLFYVGSLGSLGVPAYTRTDVRFEWKLTPQLSAIAQGQNLFSTAHREFGGNTEAIVMTQVPRTANVRLTWQF